MKKTLSLLAVAAMTLCSTVALAKDTGSTGKKDHLPKVEKKIMKIEKKVQMKTDNIFKKANLKIQKLSPRMLKENLKKKQTSNVACKGTFGPERAKCVQKFNGRGHWNASMSSKSGSSMSWMSSSKSWTSSLSSSSAWSVSSSSSVSSSRSSSSVSSSSSAQ